MVNQERVNNIVGMVRNLIELTGIANTLTDEKIDELISQALSIVSVDCSDEEREACKRDLKYRYMIQSRPGSKILNDYDQEEWYSDIKDEIDQKFWLRYKGRNYPLAITLIRAETKLSMVKNSYWVCGRTILTLDTAMRCFVVEKLTRMAHFKHELNRWRKICPY